MGCLMVNCGSCGEKYSLFGDMVHHTNANVCPFCSAEIQRSFWDSHIIPAWSAYEDTNRSLKNMHTGYNDVPLFQIEYRVKQYERGEI